MIIGISLLRAASISLLSLKFLAVCFCWNWPVKLPTLYDCDVADICSSLLFSADPGEDEKLTTCRVQAENPSKLCDHLGVTSIVLCNWTLTHGLEFDESMHLGERHTLTLLTMILKSCPWSFTHEHKVRSLRLRADANVRLVLSSPNPQYTCLP